MDNFALASSKFSLLVPAPNPYEILSRRRLITPSLPPIPARRGRRFLSSGRRTGLVPLALKSGSNDRAPSNAGREKLKTQPFETLPSSSNSEMTTSSSVAPFPVSSSSSSIGSPLFWVGVGVGLSVIFRLVSGKLQEASGKLQANLLQQTLKSMMNQAATQGGQFNNSSFGSGSPFPFPVITTSPPTAPPSTASPPSPTHVSSQQPVTVDVPATEVESTFPSEVRGKTEIEETESKKFAFVDVSPEEIVQSSPSYLEESMKESPAETQPVKEISTNGSVKWDGRAPSDQSQSRMSSTRLSVEALEKMMEDPTMQRMIYPYLPEEMRNPETFKWMMQNPQFRQQMQDMLNTMGGSNEWDNRLTESLSNFNLNSPEVKQQFEQIGLTPEEVISKIMANPEIAMAFQNPKVQAAIIDCSQNPLSIAKYQNDKEIMDVFTKISELFPGVSGFP